jgi:hypothetical protein
MTLAGRFDTLAFDFHDAPSHEEAVEIEVVSADELRTAWSRARGERRGTVPLPDGTPIITIDSDPAVGYRLWSYGVGEYLIEPGGRAVWCAPADLGAWHWQRFLIGQVLPLAAALRGLEPLHASAVSFGGNAVAFLGDSAAGKTSLAVHCVLRGAGFVADDVVATEVRGAQVVAHSGAPLAGIRHAELARIGDAERAAIGFPVTENDKEVLFRVAETAGESTLRAVYVLRRTGENRPVRFERIVDPRMLLGSTFNFMHRPPESLRALLDVCALIDATAATFSVSVPATMPAAALAEAIERHLEQVV